MSQSLRRQPGRGNAAAAQARLADEYHTLNFERDLTGEKIAQTTP